MSSNWWCLKKGTPKKMTLDQEKGGNKECLGMSVIILRQ